MNSNGENFTLLQLKFQKSTCSPKPKPYPKALFDGRVFDNHKTLPSTKLRGASKRLYFNNLAKQIPYICETFHRFCLVTFLTV